MDKPEYDRPDDDENAGNKALIFLVLAIVVVGILYGIFNTDVLG
ncbi:hypothetical protein GCM10022234_15960 [Aeromicrobium panaciterrae]